MRNDLVSPGAGEMTYEIRNIVNVAEKLQQHGVRINWENIGDPIMKGENIPVWMKEIGGSETMNDDTWGYCHTRGVLEIREFVCGLTNRTNGAFYMAVAFRDGLLNDKQSLPIANPEVKELVENLVGAPGVSPDKRFVYYLLANTGICVVPLSSFSTPLQGFRVTLLEKDKAECERVYRTLAEKIGEYLDS